MKLMDMGVIYFVSLQLFTDAGQYVVRFGDADSLPNNGPGSSVSATKLFVDL